MEVQCPRCGVELEVDDDSVGRLTICPRCSGDFRVEAEVAGGVDGSFGASADRFTAAGRGRSQATPPRGWGIGQVNAGLGLIRCPACARTLSIDRSMIGHSMICPTCRHRLKVPLPVEGSDPSVVQEAILEEEQRVTPASDPPAVSMPRFPDDDLGSAPLPTTFPSGSWPGTGDVLVAPVTEAPRGYRAPAIAQMVLAGLGISVNLPSLGVSLMQGGGTQSIMFAVALAANWLALYGALHMYNQQSYFRAKLGAWAAFYPLGGCCFLPTPFAVWSLIRLHEPGASSDFRNP